MQCGVQVLNRAAEQDKTERFSKGQSKAEDAEERLSHQIKSTVC